MSKRLINGTDQRYNLSPKKYTLPWKWTKDSLAAHWTPYQHAMGDDKRQFDQVLTAAERELYLNNFSTLTTMDVFIGDVVSKIKARITAPEVEAFLIRQIAEEGIHQITYEHVIEVVGLGEEDVYTRYERVPAIKAKFDLSKRYLQGLESGTATFEFVRSLCYFYGAYEGLMFYHGFSPALSLRRRNLMQGTGTQFAYIGKDESTHVNFGAWLVREICREEGIDQQSLGLREMFDEVLAVEDRYADDCLPAITGYSPELHKEHARFMANRRMVQFGDGRHKYMDAANVLPWLDEVFLLKKEKNFFEAHVDEYQTGVMIDFGDSGVGMHELTEGL